MSGPPRHPFRELIAALRAERQGQGLSLADVAERTGMDRAASSTWGRAERKPNPRDVDAVCRKPPWESDQMASREESEKTRPFHEALRVPMSHWTAATTKSNRSCFWCWKAPSPDCSGRLNLLYAHASRRVW